MNSSRILSILSGRDGSYCWTPSNMLTCALLIVGVLMATASPLVGRSNGIDPRYESPLTVYHLNPASAGAIPRNMDTGDALGDLYFYLGEFLLPIECLNGIPHLLLQAHRSQTGVVSVGGQSVRL